MITHFEDGTPRRLLPAWESRVGEVVLLDVNGVDAIAELWKSATVRKTRLPVGGVLDRFLRLSSPVAVHAFATKHGLLGLCKHGFPVGAGADQCADLQTWRIDRGQRPASVEMIAHWQDWRQRFGATRELATLLNRQRVSISDLGLRPWRYAKRSKQPAILTLAPDSVVGRLFATVKSGGMASDFWSEWQRRVCELGGSLEQKHARDRFLAQWLNTLLSLGRVRRHVLPSHGRLELRDGPGGIRPLFGALVVELLSQCLGGIDQLTCRECGDSFAPTHSQQIFCADCGAPKERNRRNQQKWRDRNRAKGLNTRGTPRLRVVSS